MSKFFRNYVTVDAIQYDGTDRGIGPILQFSSDVRRLNNIICFYGNGMAIPVRKSDWIIKESTGECYWATDANFEVMFKSEAAVENSKKKNAKITEPVSTEKPTKKSKVE